MLSSSSKTTSPFNSNSNNFNVLFLGNSEHPLSVLKLSGVTPICDLVLTEEETQT